MNILFGKTKQQNYRPTSKIILFFDYTFKKNSLRQKAKHLKNEVQHISK